MWGAGGMTGTDMGYRACTGLSGCSCTGGGTGALCGGLPNTMGCMPTIAAMLAAACGVGNAAAAAGQHQPVGAWARGPALGLGPAR